ncbi:MAG TPA: DNA repair exonuclease [Gammaproteobacteria bacterium]|nr:DNA repair exonuclease [Gammaproteobacteria bacterium]
MKILCVGDIHLGRRPSRLPPDVLERVDVRELSPSGAWQRTVDEALRLQVDAVLLAGDVVEQENDFYEALADLRGGIEKLTQAGVQVLGVAGNHDVQVLPLLADALKQEFRLLGRDGRWEAERIRGRDGTEVRVLGWSFPRDVVTTSPLGQDLPAREPGTTIGLLHCDRDASGSHYAPVSSTELAAAPVDAWLLGHIHKPDPMSGPRPMGYLGSLTGLDPGEPGAHGPWLLEAGAAEPSIVQIPLAPLRWVAREVSLDGLERPEDVHQRITAALDELHGEISAAEVRPLAVGCRLRLTGRTRHRDEITRLLRADDPRERADGRDGILYFVEAWRLEALPEIDLEELARGKDPPALLAHKLLILRDPQSEEHPELVAALQRSLAGTVRERNFSALRADEPDRQRTIEIAEAAALRALDLLLAQRGNAG